MALHQSRSPNTSVKSLALSIGLIPILFSHAVQDGELAAVHCAVLRTHCDSFRHAKDPAPPADGQRMSARPVPEMYSRAIEGFGEDIGLGPPYCKRIRS